MNVEDYGQPKYEGQNPCPRCKGQATWKCINDDSRLYRVTCPKCGTIEGTLTELANELEMKLD